MPESEFAAIDEQKFKRFHWLATLTTGLGVFCDGYDLSSVALVLPLILASFGQKSLTGVESAALAASALVGATAGALVFGILGQRGRMRFYGYDVLILAIAALAQAFAPGIGWLIGIRLVLGFGIGADYVLFSPTITAEYAKPRRPRARSGPRLRHHVADRSPGVGAPQPRPEGTALSQRPGMARCSGRRRGCRRFACRSTCADRCPKRRGFSRASVATAWKPRG